jgi:toxin ParE1/3/4
MSARSVIRRPRAKADLIEHFAFIARDKLEPAERFLRVVEATFEVLARMPGIGRLWESANPRLSDVRVYPLPRRFRNYLVFYRTTRDGIEILRVIHGARDLGAAMQESDEDDE